VEVGWGLCVPLKFWHVHSSPYGEICDPMDCCKKPVSRRRDGLFSFSCWSSSRESVPEKWSSSAIIMVSFSHDVKHLKSLYGVALKYMYVIISVVLCIISQCLNENKARRVFSVIRGMQATMFRWGTKVPGLDKKVDQTYSPWHSIISRGPSSFSGSNVGAGVEARGRDPRPRAWNFSKDLLQGQRSVGSWKIAVCIGRAAASLHLPNRSFSALM